MPCTPAHSDSVLNSSLTKTTLAQLSVVQETFIVPCSLAILQNDPSFEVMQIPQMKRSKEVCRGFELQGVKLGGV